MSQTDLHSVVKVGIGAFREVVEELHRMVSECIHKVAVHREDTALRGWKVWMIEDPLVHTHVAAS